MDETKYFYVFSALDQDTATCLLDLISLPPPDSKYTVLKDRILDTFGLSKLESLSLLHFQPPGGTQPSALMDEMLALLGDHPPCLLFKQLFLERLPEKGPVSGSQNGGPPATGQKADVLWAV